MTKLELQNQLKLEEKKIANLFKEENLQLEELFKDVFFEDLFIRPEYEKLEIEIKASSESCYFYAKKPSDEYKSEIFCVYFRKSDYTKKKADQIQLSYYTTSTYSDFELDRIIILGDVATIIKEQKQYKQGGLLQRYHSINNKYSKLKSILYKKQFNLQRELEELNTKIKKENEYKRLKRAFSKNGIKIEKQVGYGSESYPRIELRGDFTAHNVSNIRILDYVNPKTKKSVNIEVTETPHQYDYEKQKYFEKEPRTYKVNKVRLDNLLYYINK